MAKKKLKPYPSKTIAPDSDETKEVDSLLNELKLNSYKVFYEEWLGKVLGKV